MAYLTDEVTNEKYRGFCEAVGHLFITFGRLEGTLSAILRLHLANNLADDFDPQTGVALSSAIYGSLRFKAARDTIRRLANSEEVPETINKFLDDVFSHVGQIEMFRDKLAHQVVLPALPGAGGDWQVSDQVVTRDIKAVKFYVFGVEAVLAAAADLVLAGERLGGYLQGRKLFIHKAFDLSPISWLYKPSMLKRVSPEKARTRRSLPIQPQASDE